MTVVPGRRYEVGGAVRDALLGHPVTDRDWVVVGATPEAMVDAGFLPVGKDFPVFLHPGTKEEHALARTERKTAPGYHGFVFHASADVTLEQDLARRDLTINAIARDESGGLHDPCGGRRDLAGRVLRHVSPAFAEDPVRILRLARFAARLPDFAVAPETEALVRQMVNAGEVDALVAERVWQEFSRGLMEAAPQRMLEVLRRCGALQRLLPVGLGEGRPADPAAPQATLAPGDVDPSTLLAALSESARLTAPWPVRYALCALAWSGTGRTDEREAAAQGLGEHWRVPSEGRDLASLVLREATTVVGAAVADAPGLGVLLDRWDAWRRPSRVQALLLAARAAVRAGAPEHAGSLDLGVQRLTRALQVARAIDTEAAAREALATGARGPAIGQFVLARRIEAIHTDLTLRPVPLAGPTEARF